MKTRHRIHFSDSRHMRPVTDASVQLVVTSPPYPMIAMWDEVFGDMDERIGSLLNAADGPGAFERMHRQLDAVWHELWRILTPGGIACINVGDATRKVGDDFCLYPNHARILTQLMNIGFTPLPAILWRKPTNAPTKFMGSGMLPAGAYVTLEHEYVLIVRKGARRAFETAAEKRLRKESALFWEERNNWYSDVWLDLRGAGQDLTSPGARRRSAAFPFEVPYRLISMFSVKGDLVADPFMGTGTTMKAAMVAGRNSVGFDSDPSLREAVLADIGSLPSRAEEMLGGRLQRHIAFIDECAANGRPLKHINTPYRFAVVTGQETELFLSPLTSIEPVAPDELEATYMPAPDRQSAPTKPSEPAEAVRRKSGQLSIFGS